jgi:hypothetical protein
MRNIAITAFGIAAIGGAFYWFYRTISTVARESRERRP